AKAVASAPTVILAGGNSAALAVAPLTKTIPIVFRVNSDPVALGLVASLAHPGGNVTGAAALGSVTATKEFGFLKEMVPGLSRVAFLGRSADGATDAVQRDDVVTAGKAPASTSSLSMSRTSMTSRPILRRLPPRAHRPCMSGRTPTNRS